MLMQFVLGVGKELSCESKIKLQKLTRPIHEGESLLEVRKREKTGDFTNLIKNLSRRFPYYHSNFKVYQLFLHLWAIFELEISYEKRAFPLNVQHQGNQDIFH